MAYQQGSNQAAVMPYGNMAAQNMGYQQAHFQQANHPYGNIATTINVVTLLLPSGFHFGAFERAIRFQLPLPEYYPLQELYEEAYHWCAEAAKDYHWAIHGTHGKPAKRQYVHVVDIVYDWPPYKWLEVEHVQLQYPNGMPVIWPTSTAIVNGVTVYGYGGPSGATAPFGDGHAGNALPVSAAPAIAASPVVDPAAAQVSFAPPAAAPASFAPASAAPAVAGPSNERAKPMSRSANPPVTGTQSLSPDVGPRASSWPPRSSPKLLAPPSLKGKGKGKGKERAVEPEPKPEPELVESRPGTKYPKGMFEAIEPKGGPLEPLEQEPWLLDWKHAAAMEQWKHLRTKPFLTSEMEWEPVEPSQTWQEKWPGKYRPCLLWVLAAGIKVDRSRSTRESKL